VFRAAFASVRVRGRHRPEGDSPMSRTADVARNVKGATAEVKDWAKEAGQDVKGKRQAEAPV
jgi:hypothetical protein